jgi:hypothetical protein
LFQDHILLFATDGCRRRENAMKDESPLNRSEIVSILEENLTVTDEWGGCKLASWQWGGNVCVDGIDAAADAIVARLSKSRQTVSQDVPE